MKRKAHAFVQDTDNADHLGLHTINNDMRANRMEAVRFGQLGAGVPARRIS
jgi:hypothetical protein